MTTKPDNLTEVDYDNLTEVDYEITEVDYESQLGHRLKASKSAQLASHHTPDHAP